MSGQVEAEQLLLAEQLLQARQDRDAPVRLGALGRLLGLGRVRAALPAAEELEERGLAARAVLAFGRRAGERLRQDVEQRGAV